MNIVALVLSMAEKLLELWVNKDKDKYNAKLLSLKTARAEEMAKPEEMRDFALVDNLDFEIILFAQALQTQMALSK